MMCTRCTTAQAAQPSHATGAHVDLHWRHAAPTAEPWAVHGCCLVARSRPPLPKHCVGLDMRRGDTKSWPPHTTALSLTPWDGQLSIRVQICNTRTACCTAVLTCQQVCMSLQAAAASAAPEAAAPGPAYTTEAIITPLVKLLLSPHQLWRLRGWTSLQSTAFCRYPPSRRWVSPGRRSSCGCKCCCSCCCCYRVPCRPVSCPTRRLLQELPL